MHVEHLLQDESLGLRLLWAPPSLLEREICGVTVTDLEDPTRFVRPGEVVLSGLVWWRAQDGHEAADRFVEALKNADVAVLLAGEEAHGAVPEVLVEACARYGLPVAAVPAHLMFRTITETVYLRQWGELARHHVLPGHLRDRLNRLISQSASPRTVLTTVFAHLGDVTAYLVTAAGRTVAATPGAASLPAREAAALPDGDAGTTVLIAADTGTPYEHWYLHLPDTDAVPPGLLHEITLILARCRQEYARGRAGERRLADELGALFALAAADDTAVATAWHACGLSAEGPYHVLVADTGTPQEDLAVSALTEAVAHAESGPAVVGRLPDGTGFAVIPADGYDPVAELWPLLAACVPDTPLHGGAASTVDGPADLPTALARARYALAAARTTTPDTSRLTDAATLTSVDTLLTGIPAEVRTAYSRTVLGPLHKAGNGSAAMLLETLETFLAHDGSWARTAETLHLHVNTVHYRIQRVEYLTGRDLSRLTDRLDLWAALLCRTGPGAPTAKSGRRTRPSTSPAR
ncbi:PucR family transcriptional regulator [Streptomyces sp. S3(2020)]|uniref:PucR family transcriptional regulator n=1 Tax=Streptomyces sp. S3(2020) TaxID=2732044 RepID=UPI0014890267|nr:PucR family transcriptional regulator [Streptomyces sp. S3(2020)]NNN30415.1 PucR family transcriptional regulator [Streptomyces sp. S3(2020)]